MEKPCLIGIDLGSSFVKATIFDAAGTALAEAKRDNYPTQPAPDVAEYDAEQLLQAAVAALKQLREASGVAGGDVAAIGLDGMISGVVGIDDRGIACTPYTGTLDRRYTPFLDAAMAHHHDAIRRASGSCQAAIGPKIAWMARDFPAAFARSRKFVAIAGYVAGRLTDLPAGEAYMDRTHLWATGLADAQAGRWSPDLCKALNVPMEKLPRIVPSTAVIGRLAPWAAAATGLAAGTPIVAGAGDQSACFVAAGITRPGRLADAAGTYPVLAFCTRSFRPDMDRRMAEVFPSAIEGLWNPCMFIIGGGLTHHWFAETFARTSALGDAAYAALDAAAEAVGPGSGKLLAGPHLGGRACPTRTSYRGAWAGFSWTHKREHFYRSLLEAVAYDQALAWRSMQALCDEAPSEVRVYSGAARSALWNQIKADVLGLPYVALARQDQAALGAAIIAGAGVGLYADMAATAESFLQTGRRFEPRRDVHEFYRPYVDLYGRMLEGLDATYDALAALPEWRG